LNKTSSIAGKIDKRVEVMTLTGKDDCGYFMQTIPNLSRVLSQKLIFIARKRVSK
jgi:hypothetical protein